MSKKKYLRTSINFGDNSSRARAIIEQIQSRGENISDLVCRAVVVYAGLNNPKLIQQVEKATLVEKYKCQAREFRDANLKLNLYREQCEKAGINLDEELI